MASFGCSSIGKKQIVAVTGFLLILFLIMHLSGNLLLYKGPEAFNAYAEFLNNLGWIKIAARVGLVSLFLTHIAFTAMVVVENRKAKGVGYAVKKSVGKRSLATRLMPYTGTVVLVYLLIHLLDYTLADHDTVKSVVDGVNLGLYGLVYNSYQNPLRVAFYVVGMIAVGFHLAHATQSVFQTFGVNHPVYSKFIKRVSLGLGVLIAAGFASIPFFLHFCGGAAACSVSSLI